MCAKRLLLTAWCLGVVLPAQRLGEPTDDLTKVGIDELFSLQVTSVGRKAQKLSKAPAAVYVLTADDIRRSGASSIPEALQWVPGLTVSRIDGRSWMISARGGTRLYADKILVMMDGRSLYTPLFSGVIWDAIDVPLENIDRIEVVLGPGAVMWGPNAVNGVINIITRGARATKGAAVSAATGNELHGSVMARFGDAPNRNVAWRIWTKLDDRNPAFGSPAWYNGNPDAVYRDPGPVTRLASDSARIGFRVDTDLSEKDQLMVQGDAYTSGRQEEFGYPVLVPGITDRVAGHGGYDGGFLQAAWTRTKTPDDESTLQFTFGRDNIDYAFVGGELHNLTVDFQNRRLTNDRNEVYWGLGFQQYGDSMWTRRYGGFMPPSALFRAGDAVLRDEFQIIPDRLLISGGVRFDSSSWSRFDVQPSLRFLYTPNSHESYWFAASRAVRTPSRYDRDLQADVGEEIKGGIPFQLIESGSHTLRSTTEISLESGYRFQAGQRWSADASVFWSWYDRLFALQVPSQPDIVIVDGVPVVQVVMPESNEGHGRSWGSELSATWQLRSRWRLIPSWSYLNEVRWLPNSLFTWDAAISDPRHQGLLRLQHDLSRRLQMDIMARARSRNIGCPCPGTLLVDARLGYRPARNSELSITLHNAFDRQVVEAYAEGPFAAIPLRRTFVVRWRQSF